MQVDVAISSFRKAESLIYTLLTLHRHCRDQIGTVWITDDCSDDGTLHTLSDPALAERLQPWRIALAVTRRRGGSGRTLVTRQMATALLRPGMSWPHRLRTGWFLLTRGPSRAEDIRYERGLTRSAADHVLLLHDDIEVVGNVAGFLRQTMQADPTLAIAGPLGQCWRCGWQGVCGPGMILEGRRPGPDWPLTPPPPALRHRSYDRACRINEWCCMIRTSAARDLAAEGIHFGHAEDGGDTGAYWFAAAIARGWRFDDPFLAGGTDRWFRHGWQGHTGRSVWADQGQGRRSYNVAQINDRLAAEFGFAPRPRPTPPPQRP